MLTAVALAIVMSACGGDANEDTPSAASSDNGSTTVNLRLIAFKPESITVAAGSAVTWVNEDGTDHTVTSGSVAQQGGSATAKSDGTFESGTLPGGGRFSFTFDTPGTYSYFCKLHPATMRGQITVT